MNLRGQAASAAVALMCLGAPARPALAQQNFVVKDLGTLGGTFSQAIGINDAGLVVGASTIAGDGETHAFIWSAKGGMHDLGTLGGTLSLPAGTFSLGDQPGRGINNQGHVVGVSSIAGNLESHAFLWTPNGGMRDLGTLGGTFSQAGGINDGGAVVGAASVAGDTATHAFVWTKQKGMKDLGTLGGTFSRALAISESGHVVGSSTNAANQVHAFMWTAQGGLVDLGTLGGTFSEAFGVNEAGQVVGRSTTTGEASIHTFLWSKKTGMKDLGTLGGMFSQPSAINSAGNVVGFSTLPGEAQFHAFLWTSCGRLKQGTGHHSSANDDPSAGAQCQRCGPAEMIDLGTLGGSFSQAMALNQSSQIVGVSNTAGDAQAHAFFWSPQSGLKDLGTLGGNFSIVLAINNRKEIAGGAALAGSGEIHAVRYR